MPEEDPSEHPATDDANPQTPPQRRDYSGQTIDRKYEVVGLLGEGGMGAVYEVKHLVIGRRFAIKFLHREIAHSRSIVARFRREAEAAGRLENEHVVAVVDVGTTDDGTPYLVMEYLEGENLCALLGRCGPLPVARAVRLGLQVCRGLQAAHSRGMIHRDLKPANLFVVPGSDGHDLVKILDFGIVKLAADCAGPITHSGLTLGTPYYMSPEQARGDGDVDGRTDIYAMGVILYELVTGHKPHPGNNATAVLFHLLKQEPARIETLRSGLPTGLADVIHRAFAFDAADRFPDVASLSAALAPYSGNGPGDLASSPLPALLPARIVSLGNSSGTLSSTDLQLPGTARDGSPRRADGAGTGVSPAPRKAQTARFVGGVVALALVILAGTISLLGRLGVAREPGSRTTSPSSPATPRSNAPPSTPELSAEVSDRSLERPIGRSSADVGATPGQAQLDGSAPPAADTSLPHRSSPRPPAAASSARQLLREHLYEP